MAIKVPQVDSETKFWMSGRAETPGTFALDPASRSGLLIVAAVITAAVVILWVAKS